MSYELVIRRKDGGPLMLDALTAHFSRPPYELAKEGRFSASWSNPDTGVTFSFERDERGSLRFSVPYVRAHVVALEAQIELDALVARFDPEILDPQVGGDEPWTTARFVEAWNRGNRRAIGLLAQRPDFAEQAPRSLAYEVLEAAWRWNFGRDALQAELGDGLFVPRIFFFLEGTRVRRLVVWTDAIAAALPEVDLVLLLREDLARRWMRRAAPTAALATWAEVEAMLGEAPRLTAPIPWRRYQPAAVEERLVRFFIDRPELAVPGPVVPLRAHEVLDEELVATAGKPAN